MDAPSSPGSPTNTTGATRAVKAAREAVLAVRITDRAGILVRGTERLTWLNGLVTCDLAKLGPGQATYGLLVEKKGRIQTDLFVVPGAAELSAALALAVPSDLRDATLATLDHHLIMEDAELEAGSLELWHLHGPAAQRAADQLGDVARPFVGALDLLGSGGVLVASPDTDALGARVAAVVAELGGVIADEPSWEAVRIERGLPRFGVDVDATLYPQEASLEKLAVSFDKGCYLGQEVVYMLENRGHVKRKLVPLDVDGDAPPPAGSPVTTPDGTAIGEVKSSAIGPSSGRPVALAMVKWAQSKPGTELRAGDRAARVRA